MSSHPSEDFTCSSFDPDENEPFVDYEFCDDCGDVHDNNDEDDNHTSRSEKSSRDSDESASEDGIYVDKAIFTEWGCHYSLRQPWTDKLKPTVKIFDYEKFELNEMEREGVLTDRIIASCLSYLDKSPYVNKFVLCKCVLTNKHLKNIDILNYHHYLQYLDLSNNHLTSLKPLGQLPFLIYLDASNNSLTKILDFKAPFYLTYVNYAYNNLTNLRDLSDFWSLVFMDLAHNSIKKISGLQRLKYLRNLNLAYNEIECIENLNNLNLQILHLKNNQINRCETGVFQSMNRLVKLDVSYNQLSSLKFLHRVNNLQEVNMAENKLDCLMQLNHLRTLGKLIKLDLRGNPVCNKSDYYRVCVDCGRNLTYLDGTYISATEKVQIMLQFEQHSDFRSNVLHGRLLAIEHLQSPLIGYHVVPIDQPPPAIIALVGTIGSKKGELVREFCKENPKYTVIGVSHTTRPKNDNEINHEAYHFVTIDEFRELLKQGKFLSVFELLGNCYGFAISELEKVRDTEKVLVTHLSLEGALLLRNRGLNPTLVLAMPMDTTNHLDFLRYKYFQTSWEPGCYNILKIINCPEKAEIAREQEEKMEQLFKTRVCKNIIEEIVNDLPEEVYTSNSSYSDETDSMYDMENRSSSETERYSASSKGFSVSFQNPTNMNDLLSVNNEYNICNSRCESAELLDSFKECADYTHITSGVGDSISKTILGDEFPFLSVLSRVELNRDGYNEERDNLPQLGMKLDEMKKHFELLEPFYYRVLWLREIYFEEHNKNPGLFAGVVFTDDFSSCLEKLKIHLKKCIEHHKVLRPVFMLREDDSAYQTVIAERLKCLHIAIKRSAGVKYDLLKDLEKELEAVTAPYFEKVDRPPNFTQSKTLFKK